MSANPSRPCMCGYDLPTCGEIDGTGCPKLPAANITACPGCGAESSENYDGRGSCWTCHQNTALPTETRRRGTTVTRDEERPSLHSLTSSSFLVPSNTAEPGSPSNSSASTSPSNTSGERAEVEGLLIEHAAGRGLRPVAVELPALPVSRSRALVQVAEFYKLVRGLRLAAGDDRPVPFAARWIARKLGLEKQTAYRARCQLTACGVIVMVETMPGRPWPDGTLKRGTECYLPGEPPTDEGADW